MKILIGSLALLVSLAACSTYDSAGTGGTGGYGDTYDYQYEASGHTSAL